MPDRFEEKKSQCNFYQIEKRSHRKCLNPVRRAVDNCEAWSDETSRTPSGRFSTFPSLREIQYFLFNSRFLYALQNEAGFAPISTRWNPLCVFRHPLCCPTAHKSLSPNFATQQQKQNQGTARKETNKRLTLCRGTAGMLLVRPRCRAWGGSLDPPDPAGPAGLVGLGPPGLAPGLRCDAWDVAPGLTEGVRVGLRDEGDKWPHGPASACKNLSRAGKGDFFSTSGSWSWRCRDWDFLLVIFFFFYRRFVFRSEAADGIFGSSDVYIKS